MRAGKLGGVKPCALSRDRDRLLVETQLTKNRTWNHKKHPHAIAQVTGRRADDRDKQTNKANKQG